MSDTRESFEHLLSLWLEQPEHAERSAAVARRAAADPELARVRDAWLRLDQALRAPVPTPPESSWQVQREAIRARIETESCESLGDRAFDEHLQDVPLALRSIDWLQQRARVAAAVARLPAPGRQPMRPILRIALTGLVAAAAIALVVLLPIRPVAGPAGPHQHVEIRVSGPFQPPGLGAQALARVTISAPPGWAPAAPANPPSELFLMIEPAGAVAPLPAWAGPLGSG
jgi:hypothetical protein